MFPLPPWHRKFLVRVREGDPWSLDLGFCISYRLLRLNGQLGPVRIMLCPQESPLAYREPQNPFLMETRTFPLWNPLFLSIWEHFPGHPRSAPLPQLTPVQASYWL